MDMKTSKRIPPGTPKHHRLTSENRIIIWTLKKEGKSNDTDYKFPRAARRSRDARGNL